jgi:undecaprenyl-phosphate galactose phosphotransferase
MEILTRDIHFQKSIANAKKGSLKDLLRTITLVSTDLIGIVASFSLAILSLYALNIPQVQIHKSIYGFSGFISIWLVYPVFIVFLAYEGLYTKRFSFWDEIREIIKGACIASATVFIILFIGNGKDHTFFHMIVFLWVYSIVFLALVRIVGKKIMYKIGLWKENVIIFGAGNTGQEAALGIDRESHMGYNVVGFLDSDPGKKGNVVRVNGKQYKVLDTTDNFREYLDLLNTRTVIIAIPSFSQEQLAELTNTVQKYVSTVMLVPAFKGVALLNTELYHLFSEKLYLLNIRNSLKSPANRLVKEVFDLILSILMLPILLPLIGIIGILIKIDSKGPVFYTHARIGKNGRKFNLLKFRSMHVDSEEKLADLLNQDDEAKSEWDTYYKLRNDPRITRLGKILRQTSLDELPQIFNVLKGDMSLVGPRPVLQEEIDNFYKEYAEYYYMVKPGISGLWQVSGRNEIGYDMRVNLDTWYVLNWSLWFDTVILLKTVGVIFKKEGAF